MFLFPTALVQDNASLILIYFTRTSRKSSQVQQTYTMYVEHKYCTHWELCCVVEDYKMKYDTLCFLFVAKSLHTFWILPLHFVDFLSCYCE